MERKAMTWRMAAGVLLSLVTTVFAQFDLGALAGGSRDVTVSAAVNTTALQPGQQAALAVVAEIPAGLHTQSHTPSNKNFIAFEVKVEAAGGVQAFDPIYPPGHDQTYPALGTLNVYDGRVIVYVPLEVKADAAAGPRTIRGTVTYQACDDEQCFPPKTAPFAVEAPVVAAGQPLEANRPEWFAGFDFRRFSELAQRQGGSTRLELFGASFSLGAGDWGLAFLVALGVGVIFNVMPCVLPVVPLKAIGFYEVSQHHRGKSIALGLVFSLGIILVFLVLGLFVVVLRQFQWGELFANPWFLGAIVVILAVMAFSLFGTFSVGLPQGVYRLTPRHDTYTGNFLFGVLAAVLSTPCTFGLFLALLIWATTQPPAVGLGLLGTVGVGMALPYVLLSAFPGLARRFPRTGPWSELVKQMMGFLLLASAVFFARRFIAGWFGADVFWWALFAVVLAAGVFLVVRGLALSQRTGPRVAAAALAVLMVVPSFGFAWRQTHPPIDWVAYTQETVDKALADGRVVMLEFTADWCGNCLALEATVFHDERTVEAIKRWNVLPVRADLTDRAAPGWAALAKASKVGAVPLTAIYATGKEPILLSGIYSTGDLVAALEKAAK